MKKLLGILLALVVCAASLPGCTITDGDDGSPTAGAWSIFLYLCGTDLETEAGIASSNLYELMDVDFTRDVNVYVQTGGTETWHTEGIPSDSIARYHVKNGGMELLEEQELANMGDTNTLYDFLTWGVTNYPAEKMGFIFWDHGGGPLSGAVFDELYDNDALTLQEMEEAFETVHMETGALFEMVGFDACLMASIETANVFAPYAEYLVASEELEPGGGWDYNSWVQYLCENPDTTGADLGRAICDGYYEKCIADGDEGFVTLSTMDLTKLPTLLRPFDAMSGVLKDNINDEVFFAEVARGATRSISFGGDTPGEGYTNQLDLGDLMNRYSEFMPEEAEAVLAGLKEVVVYQVKGGTTKNASGMSLFSIQCVVCRGGGH